MYVARAVVERHAALGDGRRFPGPAFDESEQGIGGHGNPRARSSSARRPSSTRSSSSPNRKSISCEVDVPASFDPSLFTVFARVKNSAADAVYVRDQILAAVARARSSLVPADRLADAKSFNRYAFARGIDSTERVAAVVSQLRRRTGARIRPSTTTTARSIRSTPADLQAAARAVLRRSRPDRDDAVARSAAGRPSSGRRRSSSLRGAAAVAASGRPRRRRAARAAEVAAAAAQREAAVHGRLGPRSGRQGRARRAHRRDGRREPARKTMTIDQIDAALYPMAGSFSSRTDKEMTTLTGLIHRDQWQTVPRRSCCRSCSIRAGATEDFDAPQRRAAQRARPGSALEQRRGARQGAAADEHLPRHALRPRRARHGGRPQRHHAGRREGVRQADVHAGQPDASASAATRRTS